MGPNLGFGPVSGAGLIGLLRVPAQAAPRIRRPVDGTLAGFAMT